MYTDFLRYKITAFILPTIYVLISNVSQSPFNYILIGKISQYAFDLDSCKKPHFCVGFILGAIHIVHMH